MLQCLSYLKWVTALKNWELALDRISQLVEFSVSMSFDYLNKQTKNRPLSKQAILRPLS